MLSVGAIGRFPNEKDTSRPDGFIKQVKPASMTTPENVYYSSRNTVAIFVIKNTI